jgi:hypothetical protein
MKPFSSTAVSGVRLGFGVICGALALVQGTAADRLVDGSYDSAIAIAAASTPVAASTVNTPHVTRDLLRLSALTAPALTTPAHAIMAVGKPPVVGPMAATEHAWLTALPGAIEAKVAVTSSTPAMASLFLTSVGSRFEIVQAGGSQTLEVVEVRPLAVEFSRTTPTIGPTITMPGEAPNKQLLVTCKVVAAGAVDVSVGQQLRFVVDVADLAPASQPTSPRAL